MISRGKMRAEGYSMLGKSQTNFSELSVMSSAKKKSKMFSGRLSPIEGGDTFRSKKSSQRSRSRKGN